MTSKKTPLSTLQLTGIALYSIFILYGFGLGTLGTRLYTQINGTIVAVRDDPFTGAPRYASIYTLREDNGFEFNYVAGCTDASLPRSLPVGTVVKKERWSWSPEINGSWEFDPAYILFLLMVGSAAIALAWSAFKLLDSARSREPS